MTYKDIFMHICTTMDLELSRNMDIYTVYTPTHCVVPRYAALRAAVEAQIAAFQLVLQSHEAQKIDGFLGHFPWVKTYGIYPPTKWWFNGGLMGFNQQNGGFNGIYPLVNIHIAIEHGHRNSGFSHEKWWFSIAKC